MAQALVEKHDGEVPADMDALTALPGVGRKTANVVLGHALGVPGLPVDRHVLRVANRIGVAEGDDPEQVEAQLCALLPKERWTRASDCADSPRPPRLQTQAALPDVPRPGVLRLLPVRRRVDDAAGRGRNAETQQRRNARTQQDADDEERRHHQHRPNSAARKRATAETPRCGAAKADVGARTTGCVSAARAEARQAHQMTRAQFEQHVATALATIPKRFRDAMRNIAIVVEDEPDPELLAHMEAGPDDTLFGLYIGTPLTERQWGSRQRAARSHHPVPGFARARGRGRGRPDRVDRGDADSRDRALFRPERRGDRGTSRSEYWRGDARRGLSVETAAPLARKRFGQHFLEPVWARKVVAAINPQPTEAFIEIGPGPGAITRPLAEAAGSRARLRDRSRPCGGTARRTHCRACRSSKAIS